MPEVTVLMSVYNGEPYVREAIESILGQTFEDFEFLIVDDGSTDGTREVTRSYADPRMHLIENERNLGLTTSLNRGLALSRGEFVARQDADDISEPERLARQVAFLREHPDVALLGSGYRRIDDGGRVIKEKNPVCDCTELRWRLLFYCPFVHSAVMLRRGAVLNQVGFYDETLSYAQDYELWHRIARRAAVANLPELLLRLRVHPRSMTATYAEREQEEERIKIAHIGRLLGWDPEAAESNAPRARAMAALLFGSPADLDPEQVQRAAGELIRLHAAFCRSYGLGGSETMAHRAALRERLSRRLLYLARLYLNDGARAAARKLLLEAGRLHWPALLEKGNARVVMTLLLRRHSHPAR